MPTRDYLPGRTRPISFTLRKNQNLRAMVFERDGFRCRNCGWSPSVVPGHGTYSGRYTVGESLGRYLVIDHIKPRRWGGKSTPSNLQTLCDRCNSRKVTDDRRRYCKRVQDA